jgi:hypothetical protein
MNAPIRFFHLSPRGAGGLACDRAGVALGDAELVRAGPNYEVAPPAVLARLLGLAYGPQPDGLVFDLHRGLGRVARALKADELALAGIEAVLLALPDPTPDGLAKLAKWGTAWQNQPRVPAGNPTGGQWTTDDEDAPSTPSRGPAFDDGVYRPNGEGTDRLPINDGVDRSGVDSARITLTGGGEEEEPPRSNGPPQDVTTLEQVFPGLKDTPGLTVTLEPMDGFLGVSALAEEANAEATAALYQQIVAQIREIDPTADVSQFMPPGGIDGLSWQERANLIDGLLMQRAAAYCNMRGDIGPLQVETLRFLQKAVDAAYDEAVAKADAKLLQPRLSRQEAIGNYIDSNVRSLLRRQFNDYGISFGAGEDITVNNRDYQTLDDARTYRIPDARLGEVDFDWTLSPKSIIDPQIDGFFAADSQPSAVVIIRPSQLGQGNTYLIPRPRNAGNRR